MMVIVLLIVLLLSSTELLAFSSLPSRIRLRPAFPDDEVSPLVDSILHFIISQDLFCLSTVANFYYVGKIKRVFY